MYRKCKNIVFNTCMSQSSNILKIHSNSNLRSFYKFIIDTGKLFQTLTFVTFKFK